MLRRHRDQINRLVTENGELGRELRRTRYLQPPAGLTDQVQTRPRQAQTHRPDHRPDSQTRYRPDHGRHRPTDQTTDPLPAASSRTHRPGGRPSVTKFVFS